MANTYNWVANFNSIGLSPLLTDTAGRQNVALPIVLGDYKFIHDLLPDQFDTYNSGTGAVAHAATQNSAQLTTAATNDRAIIQTRQWHPYFNGKSQIPEFTFINLEGETNVIKRIGYYNGSGAAPYQTSLDGAWLQSSGATGVYLEVWREGTPLAEVAQADWDDPLDGTGASGITADWTKFIVCFFDFLYLGGAGFRLFFVMDGQLVLAHTYEHSNQVAGVIMGTPQQPLRAEMYQFGAGSGTFHFVCGQVSSNGDSNQLVGFPRSVRMGARSTLSNAGTKYALLGYRLKSGYRSISLFQEAISIVSTANASSFDWEILIDPTVATGSITGWANILCGANSGAEYWKTGGTIPTITANTGVKIAGGTEATRTSISGQISKLRRIGSYLDSTMETAILCVTPHDNNTQIAATLSFNEI